MEIYKRTKQIGNKRVTILVKSMYGYRLEIVKEIADINVTTKTLPIYGNKDLALAKANLIFKEAIKDCKDEQYGY